MYSRKLRQLKESVTVGKRVKILRPERMRNATSSANWVETKKAQVIISFGSRWLREPK